MRLGVFFDKRGAFPIEDLKGRQTDAVRAAGALVPVAAAARLVAVALWVAALSVAAQLVAAAPLVDCRGGCACSGVWIGVGCLGCAGCSGTCWQWDPYLGQWVGVCY
jgi:hypothetical protein